MTRPAPQTRRALPPAQSDFDDLALALRGQCNALNNLSESVHEVALSVAHGFHALADAMRGVPGTPLKGKK